MRLLDGEVSKSENVFVKLITTLLCVILFCSYLNVNAQPVSSGDVELLRRKIIQDFDEPPKIAQINVVDYYAFGVLIISINGELQEGEGKLFVSTWDSTGWTVYYEGSEKFLETVIDVPDSLVSQGLKDILLSENLSQISQDIENQRIVTGYKLPWPCGVTRYVRNDWDRHVVVSTGIALDIDMPLNDVITAAASGTVSKIQENQTACGCNYSIRDKGNYITIHNDQGFFDTYVHIAQWGAIPNVGDYVVQGQPIAYSYKTGHTCGSRATCDSGTCTVSDCNVYTHLHFDVKDNNGNRLRPVFEDVGEVEIGNYTSGNCMDTTPPTNPTSINPGCTATSNVWQNTCNNPSFSWSGASDSQSGVAGYQFYWGTSSSGTSSNYTTSNSYKPSVVSDGTYYFRIRTKDKAGNFASWKTMFILKYDGTAPTNPGIMNSGCSAQNNLWQNSCNQPGFTWSGASDSSSGVAGYQYYWGTSSAGTSSNYTSASSYSPSAVSDGTYYFRVRTKDNAGNYASWKTMFILRYDATLPTGSISINEDDLQSNKTLVKLRTSGEDNLSGVESIRIRNYGNEWSSWLGFGGYHWLLPPFTNQLHRVEAEVIDSAGNISLIFFDEIFLDVYPPRPFSSRYMLVKSTFGMSGTHALSNSYHLSGTLSQSSPIGVSYSDHYKLASGYWSWIFLSDGEIIVDHNVFLPLLIK